MKIKYINIEKFKNKQKYKLLTSAIILSGILSISSCGLNISKTDINNVQNTNDIGIQQNITEEYTSQLIFKNLSNLKYNDSIGIIDKKGIVYSGILVTKKEQNHTIITPSQDFIICSKQLGNIEVHIEPNSKTSIYVDYHDKTISYETIQNEHVKIK